MITTVGWLGLCSGEFHERRSKHPGADPSDRTVAGPHPAVQVSHSNGAGRIVQSLYGRRASLPGPYLRRALPALGWHTFQGMSEQVQDMSQEIGGDPVWRDQYLNERKKARIFMGSTAVLAVLLAGSLVFAVGQSDPSPVAEPGFSSGQLGSGGGPGGGSGDFVQRFLNPDGSVNEAQVAEFKQRMEQFGGDSRSEERIVGGIQAAVDSGQITQESADELLAALGMSGADG